MLKSVALVKCLLTKLRMVYVSKKVPNGILISVPSGCKWVVLKSVAKMPTDERGYTVNGMAAAEL